MFEFDFEHLEEEESPREKFQPGVLLGKRKTDGEGDLLLKSVDKDFQALKCLVLTSWESKVPPQSYPPKK